MNEDEKAAQTAATVTDGDGQILFDGFKPDSHFITEGLKLEELLLHGHMNGIPAEALSEMLGLRSTRQLRLMVQRSREAGHVILSGDRGYYLPDQNPAIASAEKKACASRLRSMGCSLLREARVIEREA